MSLFLIGSCNEKSVFLDFKDKPDIVRFTKGELMRYGYAVQAALIQTPENIKKLRAQDIKIAFSTPDLHRKDGKKRVWQYRTNACVMDVYWNGAATNRDVDYVEFRSRRVITSPQAEMDETSHWKCVQTIIQDRQRQIHAGFDGMFDQS